MAIPTLPRHFAKYAELRSEYEQWAADVTQQGLDDAEVQFDWTQNIRPNIQQHYYRIRTQHYEQDTYHDVLPVESNPSRSHRFASAVRDVTAKSLARYTLVLNIYGGDAPAYNTWLRGPLVFTALNLRVPAELVRAGAGRGFLRGEPAEAMLLKVLEVEQNYDPMAEQVLRVLGDTNDFDGQSYFRRFTLEQRGKGIPVDYTPMFGGDTKAGLVSVSTLLSHEWLTATAAVEGGELLFTDANFVSPKVLEHLEKLPAAYKDDCVYRALLEAYKDNGTSKSWDAHYKKNSKKLTHELLRDMLGQPVGGGWKVRIGDLGKFFGRPELSLSCVVLDLWGNVLWKRVWEKSERNENIYPECLYLILHNEHVYRVGAEFNSVKNIRPAVQDRDVQPVTEVTLLDPPAPVYRVSNEAEELLKFALFADSLPDVENLLARLPELVAQPDAEEEEERSGTEDDEARSHHKPKTPRVTIHYPHNMEDLFLHFRNKRNYEADVQVHDSRIKSFRLNLTDAYVTITQFSLERDPSKVRNPASRDEFASFLPALSLAKRSMLCWDFMSFYSSGLQRAFQVYSRGALVRNFLAGKQEGVGVDIRSAYPAMLNSVDKLPVFCRGDEFKAYGGEPVEAHSVYIVESLAPPDNVEVWLVLNKKFNLVSGWTLLNCGIGRWFYTIHAVCKPVHLEANPFADVVARVARETSPADPDLLTDAGKSVLNQVIGLFGRRKVQNSEGKFTTSLDEAAARGKPFVFADGYISVRHSVPVVMENGFYPLQFVVYDRMRIALLNLFRALVAGGSQVFGVHTDCFVVDKVPADLLVSTGERRVSNMGSYRVQPEDSVDYPMFTDFRNNGWDAPVPVDLRACVEPVDCEVVEKFTHNHHVPPMEVCYPLDQPAPPPPADEHLPVHVFQPFAYTTLTKTFNVGTKKLLVLEDGTLVLGACAGSGKTTTCVANTCGKTLVVVPTNKRVDEFQLVWKEGKFPAAVTEVQVMTTAEFLGKRIKENADGTKTTTTTETGAPSLDDYDCVLIDEFYQSPVQDILHMCERIRQTREVQTSAEDKFMRRLKRWLVLYAQLEHDYAVRDGTHRWDNRAALLEDIQKLRQEVTATRRTKFVANGDTFQLSNCENWNNMGGGLNPKQDYVDSFVWRVFPKRVMLDKNWRLLCECDECSGQVRGDKFCERDVLKLVLQDLKDGKRPLEVLRHRGLESQIFTDVAKVAEGRAEPMTCLVWTNPMGNVLNKMFGGEERVGMDVVVKKYMMRNVKEKDEDGNVRKVKKGLRTNTIHEVLDISPTQYQVFVPDYDEARWLDKNKFRRTIAWTTHAVQGETIKDDFAIFEANANRDWRLFYTQFSRAEHLRTGFNADGTAWGCPWVYAGENLFRIRDFKTRMETKMKANLLADAQAGREVTNPVDWDWFRAKFIAQNFRCAGQGCRVELPEDWEDGDELQPSVDRVNAALAHEKSNCRITCLTCNKRTAHEGKATKRAL